MAEDCPPVNVGPSVGPKPGSGGGGASAGVCVDIEITCWVDPAGPTDEILYFQQIYDCSNPAAPVLLTSQYLNPLTLAVFDPIAAGWTPSVCANSLTVADPEVFVMWRRTVVTAGGGGGEPDLITYTPFIRANVYDAAGNIAATNDHFYDGTAVPAPGAGQSDEASIDVEVESIGLCEYDPASGQRIGEFIRRWHVETPSGDIVQVAPAALFQDFELDGHTPYVLTPGTITRSCENEVPCDSDPCVSGLDRTVAIDPNIPVPSVFNGSGFSSFQFDNPPTGLGSNIWKIDIFDGGAPGQGYDLVGTNGFETGRLVDWLRSGPGGDRPPADEIFVVRDVIGGPGGPPVGLPPATNNFQAAGVPLIIPGWAVEERGVGWFHFAGNPGFLNITIDLNIVNPQRCDLTAIDLDPANFPGVSIQDVIDGWQAVIDDHFSVLPPIVDPNLAFEVGITGTGDVDIYTFSNGNPVQADSVVLCQTITSTVVCFDEEDEPLESISATNSVGQVVFGPFFRRLNDGAFVQPQGRPVDCTRDALEKYETFCGTCSSDIRQQVFNGSGSGAPFQMGQTNTSPGLIIMRFVQGAGVGPSNIVDEICNWYAAGDQQSVFVNSSVNGGFWAGRPIVIPWWSVQSIDCSTPNQCSIIINPDPDVGHPNGCRLSDDGTLDILWTQFVAAQNQQFANTGHPLQSFTEGDPVGNYQIYNLETQGGPALRTLSCDPNFDPIPMCDNLGDGTVVSFRRHLEVDTDGNPSTVDRLYDGTLYTVMGTVSPGDSFCAVTDPDQCEVGEVCQGVVNPSTTGPHGFPNDPSNGWAGTFTNPSAGVFTNLNIVSIDNPAFVDDMMACAYDLATGQPTGAIALTSEYPGVFGTAGFAIGGVGLTNVVQNAAGDWTFDLDMNATLADLQNQCPGLLAEPVTLPAFGVPLTQTVNDWFVQFITQFVFAGFPLTMQSTSDWACVTTTQRPVFRSAILTKSCDPRAICVDGCDSSEYDIAPAANGPTWNFELDNYVGVGDTQFSIIVDLTNELAWFTALQAWAADRQDGDGFSLPGTWVSGGGGNLPLGAGGNSPIIIYNEALLADPFFDVPNSTVTFTLDFGRSPLCPETFFTIGGFGQPGALQEGVEEFLTDVAFEFLRNPGFFPGPVQVQSDQGDLFIFRSNAVTTEVPRVKICDDVEVSVKEVNSVPDIFLVGNDPDALSNNFNLDALAASSYSIEVLPGAVALLGQQGGTVPQVPLTPGNTYTFGIDGNRGMLYRGAASGFFLNVPTGDCIVFYTRSV